MFLRPTPAATDPALPGSTRRQQISVRPAAREGARLPASTSRRSERPAPAGPGRSERAPMARPEPRPSPARPRPAMVVSPVSLTPEELRPGAPPKMPTLLGLGGVDGALERGAEGGPDEPAVPLVRARAAKAKSPALAALPGDGQHPGDVGPSVRLLADFALKLSLGPLSELWLPEVRRAAVALLLAAKQRHHAALAGVCIRLLELLPSELSGADAASPGPLEGNARERILHQVSRFSGLLPEWPAAAQDLAQEARRREGRIVRELLAAVDGLRRDQRARVEEHLRLDALEVMGVEALAAELSAPIERASELSRLLGARRRERSRRAPDLDNTAALRKAVDQLEQRALEFDSCDPEQKEVQRALRQKRREAMTHVQLLLAECGELEQLDLLVPLSTGERIERLRSWLDSERPS